MATDLIQEQLNLYERLAGDTSWQSDTANGKFRLQLQEAIELGLLLWEQIRRRNDEMADRRELVSDTDMFTREEATYLHGLYDGWRRASEAILSHVSEMDIRFNRIEGAESLRAKAFIVRLEGPLEYDRMAKVMQAINEGRVKPLREAVDELRRSRK